MQGDLEDRGSLRKSEASSFQEQGKFLWRELVRELVLPLTLEPSCLSKETSADPMPAL